MGRPLPVTTPAGGSHLPPYDPNVEIAELVSATAAGDPRAADRLYRLVRPGLLRIALALGVGADSADDLVQETLWAAHRNLHRYRPERSSFEGWLAVILVRRTRNAWRGVQRFRRTLARVGRGTRSTGERSREVVEARLTLRRLLGVLSRRQREVVALYEIGELDAGRVSEILKISPAGVRSIARDARRRLTEAARRQTAAEENRR